MSSDKRKRDYLPSAPDAPKLKVKNEKPVKEKEPKEKKPGKEQRFYLPVADLPVKGADKKKKKKDAPAEVPAAEITQTADSAQTEDEVPAEKPEENKEKKSGKKDVKKILVIVLAAVILVESVAFAFMGLRGRNATPAEVREISITLDTSALGAEIGGAVTDTANELIDGIKSRVMPTGNILDVVKKVVYSDAIVNTVMSISYPLLYNTLDSMGLMDFAENVSLYPTGPQYAKLIEGKGYTATDKDGAVKPLTEILEKVGSDWTYMDTKVTVAKADGTTAQTSIWNSINWGVTDKASFYAAMENMSLGLRGVLEVALQHKEKPVVINPIEYLLGFGGIDIKMDAATVFADTEKSGYALCLIPLFNMLGLDNGDYADDAAFCAYENLGEIWAGILEPVLTAVDKAVKDPVNVLPFMLVNFADRLDSGALKESMLTLRLDGDYSDVASLAMGYEDGLIFNLGDALIKIVADMGINIGGSFNDCLDSLLAMISKNKNADMPDMDVARLKEGAQTVTCASGEKMLKPDSQKVIDYLIEYAVNENIVSAVLNMTPLAGTETAQKITAAVGQSKDGFKNLAGAVVDLVLEKLGSKQ